MATIGVGSKYHLSLNGVGYLCAPNGYTKKDSPVFIPRFGTGETGPGDLNVFKSQPQSDFSGGGFQEEFLDDKKFSSIVNGVYNKYDKRLYPVPSPTSPASIADLYAWNGGSLWTIYGGVLYFYVEGMGSVANWYPSLYKYNPSSKTVSSVKTDFAKPLSGMCAYAGYLWVGATDYGMYRYDGSSWLGGTNFHPGKMINFRNDRMLASAYPAAADRANIHYFLGTDVTQPGIFIGRAGDGAVAVSDIVSYNGRAYIGKADGLFVYDGVQISTLLDKSIDYSPTNFKWLRILNGILYFTIKNAVYSYNGSTIELILDFGNYETIIDMLVLKGRLYVQTNIAVSYSDKFGGTNDSNIHYYDGVSWFTYNSITNSDTFKSPSHLMAIDDGTYEHLIAKFFGVGASYLPAFKIYDIGNEFVAATSEVLTIYTTVFDADLPNIDKYFEKVFIDYANIAASDTIVVSYRTYNDNAWSSYQSLGTITSASANGYLKRFETAFTGTFRQIQFKVVVTRTNTSNLTLKRMSYDYYLSPDQSWEWHLTLQTQGSTEVPLPLVNDNPRTYETKTAAELRDNIYNARRSDAPVGFEDIDFNQLNGSHNNSITTVTVDSTKGFRDSGMIKVDDEIIKYTSRTATTFMGCTRAYLSTSAASHSDNAIVTAYFRAIVTSIDNERVQTPNQLSTGQESQIIVTLREVL